MSDPVEIRIVLDGEVYEQLRAYASTTTGQVQSAAAQLVRLALEPYGVALEPAVQRFAEVLQEHLNETVPEKGPWQEVEPAYALERLWEKAVTIADHNFGGMPIRQQRADLVKLACRVFILLGVGGMLELKQ